MSKYDDIVEGIPVPERALGPLAGLATRLDYIGPETERLQSKVDALRYALGELELPEGVSILPIIYPEFLSSPKALFNLLSSSRSLKGLSGVTPIYQTFVLTFPGTVSFSYQIPGGGYTGFIWYFSYRVSAGLEGNIAGSVTIDGKPFFADPVHLKPEFGSEFTHFEGAHSEIAGTWVSAVAGVLQLHGFGMILRGNFYEQYIEPLFDAVGKNMGMGGQA